jgi:hypothetical protein
MNRSYTSSPPKRVVGLLYFFLPVLKRLWFFTVSFLVVSLCKEHYVLTLRTFNGCRHRFSEHSKPIHVFKYVAGYKSLHGLHTQHVSPIG